MGDHHINELMTSPVKSGLLTGLNPTNEWSHPCQDFQLAGKPFMVWRNVLPGWLLLRMNSTDVPAKPGYIG